jgi:hypothetical protein
MSELIVRINKEGIKVQAEVRSIADTQDASELFEAAGMGLQLTHNMVREHFLGNEVEFKSQALVPRVIDGEFDRAEEIEIGVADLPRSLDMFPPEWFTEGVKRMFPNEGWETMSGQPEKEVCGSYEGKPLVTADIPCTEIEEYAMHLFVNESSKNGPFLDHSGWLEKSDGRDVLVSEPYGINSTDLAKMITFLEQFGWAFNIKGLSGHYPSRTICIEIYPKECTRTFFHRSFAPTR